MPYESCCESMSRKCFQRWVFSCLNADLTWIYNWSNYWRVIWCLFMLWFDFLGHKLFSNVFYFFILEWQVCLQTFLVSEGSLVNLQGGFPLHSTRQLTGCCMSLNNALIFICSSQRPKCEWWRDRVTDPVCVPDTVCRKSVKTSTHPPPRRDS